MRMSLSALAALVLAAGCPNVENPEEDNEQEVITTVRLTFTPQLEGGGPAIVVSHADPENDGNPVIDPITLQNGVVYTLAVEFLNELEDPAEDITEEIADEDDEHQVFIYGSAVEGPATSANANKRVEHAYADEDGDGLPLGLLNTITAVAAGTGDFKLMLRHLPPEGGNAQKTANLAADFAAGGSAGIAGDVDADVTFPLTVE
jgi:hypothetical protein